MSVASNSQAVVTQQKHYRNGEQYIYDTNEKNVYLNDDLTAGNVAVNYTNAAENDLDASVEALRQSAAGTASGIKDWYSLVTGGESATEEANKSATRQEADAARIRELAATMGVDIDAIRGYADQQAASSADLTNAGREYLQAGSDILNMNATATGIAGDYIAALRAIDPDRYVASAAADVQGSYASAYQQLMRQISRTGSTGSGMAGALKQQWARTLANAQAAAKTKARQTGVSEKLSALASAFTTAEGASKQGADLTTQGVSALSAAADTKGKAISGVATQAATQAQAASVDKAATDTRTSAYTSNAALLNSAVSAQNLVNSANKDYAEGLQSRASYYNEQAKSWGEIAGEDGLMDALFADRVSEIEENGDYWGETTIWGDSPYKKNVTYEANYKNGLAQNRYETANYYV